MGYAAVIVAGGAGRRLSGMDKPAIEVGGRSLLARAVAAVADASDIVVVGPERPLDQAVIWTREDPPGTGPLAALAAGLAALGPADEVVILAADLPNVTQATVRRLRDALAAAERREGAPRDEGQRREGPPRDMGGRREGPPCDTGGRREGPPCDTERPEGPLRDSDERREGALRGIGGPAGAVLVDGDGRRQWLLGVWRRDALQRVIPADPANKGIGRTLGALPLVEVPAEAGEAADVDTPDDLAALDGR